MAAKSKKRLSKIENKLLKFDKLELKDVICSICQSILIEPVTLPCFHAFCQRCFNGSVENNALCCPLCRLRIGSWLRTATKRKTLINIELWNFIQNKFSQEIDIKLRGDELDLPEEKPITRLSLPGEIRSEYEKELQRLRAERQRLEEKHIEETELLIKKIQHEEEEAHKRYLETIKDDEALALKIHKEHMEKTAATSTIDTNTRLNQRESIKLKLKTSKIDGYLSKVKPSVDNNIAPVANSSCNNVTPTTSDTKLHEKSPKHTSSYGKLIKDYMDKKVWNKENGDKYKDKMSEKPSDEPVKPKLKNSLLVSLPLPCAGIRQKVAPETCRTKETGSVDSMQQELCYFKPIEGAKPTSGKKGFPLRVPSRRLDKETVQETGTAPTRAQYLEGLCRLRNNSLSNNLPSAFVIALSLLTVKKDNNVKRETGSRLKDKKALSTTKPDVALRRYPSRNKHNIQIDGITKVSNDTNLRRTRSMGSMNDEEIETTPKKAKISPRKACSERKPHLRSDSKKIHNNTSPFESKPNNNNKINVAVKNLSSPLQNCDVKQILQEQLRIEEIIEQEKNDFELACKIEAEWNGRRQPRRAAIKRQVSINYALRPAKKLKV